MLPENSQRRFRISVETASTSASICLGIGLLTLYGLTFSVSPINGEDFDLSRFGDAGFVDNLLWASHRSISQFERWNARFGELLAIFWLAMPGPWFTAASVVAFGALCWCITAIARRSMRFDRTFLSGWLAALSLCVLVWPRLEVFFWRTAVAEYLQPLVLSLLVVLVFIAEDFRLFVVRNARGVIALSLTAFLAGMSLENWPPALLIYFGWRFVCIRREGGKLRGLAIIGFAYALGWIALMIAPSTRYRVSYFQTSLHLPPMSLAYLLIRTHYVVAAFVKSGLELGVVFAICALFMVLGLRASGREFPAATELLLPGLLSCASVALAPYVEPRAFALAWVSMLVLIVWVLCHVENMAASPWRRVPVLALAFLALGVATGVYAEYARFGEQVARRFDIILANVGQSACKSGIEVPRLRTYASRRILVNRELPGESNAQIDLYFGCRVVIK